MDALQHLNIFFPVAKKASPFGNGPGTLYMLCVGKGGVSSCKLWLQNSWTSPGVGTKSLLHLAFLSLLRNGVGGSNTEEGNGGSFPPLSCVFCLEVAGSLCMKIFNLGSLAPHGLAVEETCLTCRRLLSSFFSPCNQED